MTPATPATAAGRQLLDLTMPEDRDSISHFITDIEAEAAQQALDAAVERVARALYREAHIVSLGGWLRPEDDAEWLRLARAALATDAAGRTE